jgi:transposase
MKTPTKFISELSEEQLEELRELMKTANEQVRRRAHAILLSVREYSVDEIADIYEVDRDTVCHWLARWEDDGTGGLHDQAGRGRKPTLNEKE